MKLILLFAFLLSGQNICADTAQGKVLRRSNGLLRFIVENKSIRDPGLGMVIGKRCSRYVPEQDKQACKSAVKKMLQILDYDVLFSGNNSNPKSFVFIAFKQELISLLNDELTENYLNLLNKELYTYISGKGKRPNIWEITLKFTKNPLRSALVIAALFQDTSTQKLHLEYLDRTGTQGPPKFSSNKELLSRVIDNINMILDISEDQYRALFYPEAIYQNLNRSIYHFYVPLYLTMALAQNGFEAKSAYQAPFLLNLTYEFITSANDYRYIWSDPERIDPTEVKKLKDIYGGYCGASFSLRGTKLKTTFEDIQETFARSTVDAVQLMLKQ